jgi:hypothetical protein
MYLIISLKLSLKNRDFSWAWWHTPVIPALGRLKQKNHGFKASLGYIVRPCLKKKNRISSLKNIE